MPEGPEIKRAADEIAAAIAHRPIVEVRFAFDRLKPYEPQFASNLVTAVDPKGKALLIRFNNQLSIYSHNQLYGKWVIRNAYSYPETTRQLRLAIHTQEKSALLYSASDIEVLTESEIAVHPFLSRIGPDVLDASVSLNAVIQRFQDKRFYRRSLTALLLDQHFLSGLGNYLRSEVLFVARLHPTLRPVDCDNEAIARLAEAAIAISRRSYETGGITNDPNLAAQLRQQGVRRQAYRHWVFNREGEPCFVCGTPIVKDIAGRRYYYCPNCQKKHPSRVLQSLLNGSTRSLLLRMRQGLMCWL
ncbi:endonuclease VIII [Oculatella sp. LEGE 06141]|uniref:endonuclease VIII n=1 Tax=Oculatella sp. LEGE 06141 TaxID=1828648 RepID=UPI001881AE32|nr:endonuclease VIII [Oculatella sp. LEGE 06141]MBE9179755.1 endonuclease VIII [Oculatella sp. LEGE 06141]